MNGFPSYGRDNIPNIALHLGFVFAEQVEQAAARGQDWSALVIGLGWRHPAIGGCLDKPPTHISVGFDGDIGVADDLPRHLAEVRERRGRGSHLSAGMFFHPFFEGILRLGGLPRRRSFG